MSTLLQLWREVCGRSPALVNQEGKHLIVGEADLLLLGNEMERLAKKCVPDEDLVWMLAAQAERMLAEKSGSMGYRAACNEVIREVLTEFMLENAGEQKCLTTRP